MKLIIEMKRMSRLDEILERHNHCSSTYLTFLFLFLMMSLRNNNEFENHSNNFIHESLSLLSIKLLLSYSIMNSIWHIISELWNLLIVVDSLSLSVNFGWCLHWYFTWNYSDKIFINLLYFFFLLNSMLLKKIIVFL